MKIAIVTEKPEIVRRVSPHAQQMFPGATLMFPVVWPIGLYGPKLPRGLEWRDYPHIADFDVNRFAFRRGALGISEPPVGQFTAEGDLEFRRGVDLVEASVSAADQLIVLGSNDALYHVDVMKRMVLGTGLAPGEVRPINALDANTIRTALAGQQPGEHEWAMKMVSYGETKRYFDYQFAINSLAVFGRTLGEDTWISKYQIQALYMLNKIGSATEGKIHRHMSDWAGTGRYRREGALEYVGLGSAMSRAAILEQMENRGWIDVRPLDGRPPRTLAVSEHGLRVLERLHPGCEDIDLPFRLACWAELGLAESKRAIDRYIRTYFGRQKRFWETMRVSG